MSGGVTAIILLAILQYAFPDGMIGYAVGGSVAAIALTLSVWLLRQGKALTAASRSLLKFEGGGST